MKSFVKYFVITTVLLAVDSCKDYFSCGTCVTNGCVFIQNSNKMFICLSWADYKGVVAKRTFRTVQRCSALFKEERAAASIPPSNKDGIDLVNKTKNASTITRDQTTHPTVQTSSTTLPEIILTVRTIITSPTDTTTISTLTDRTIISSPTDTTIIPTLTVPTIIPTPDTTTIPTPTDTTTIPTPTDTTTIPTPTDTTTIPTPSDTTTIPTPTTNPTLMSTPTDLTTISTVTTPTGFQITTGPTIIPTTTTTPTPTDPTTTVTSFPLNTTSSTPTPASFLVFPNTKNKWETFTCYPTDHLQEPKNCSCTIPSSTPFKPVSTTTRTTNKFSPSSRKEKPFFPISKDGKLARRLKNTFRRFRLRQFPLTERALKREINRMLCRLGYFFLVYGQTWNLGAEYVRIQINNPMMNKGKPSNECLRFKNIKL